MFATIGCAPAEGQSECSNDSQCTARGSECDILTAICVPKDVDYTTTAETTPPANFTDKPVPFFRGEVCTASNTNIQGGGSLPLTFRPCLHPCLTPKQNSYKHQWFCYNQTCSALTAFWMLADGNNCPVEAWGEFDASMCTYPVEVEGGIGPLELSDGSPIQGSFIYEIPFFTNDDIAEIADFQPSDASSACQAECGGNASCLERCFIESVAYRYVQQSDRTISFALSNTNPAPPSSCAPGAAGCTCVPIGFGG